jgi:hypothetical protein
MVKSLLLLRRRNSNQFLRHQKILIFSQINKTLKSLREKGQIIFKRCSSNKQRLVISRNIKIHYHIQNPQTTTKEKNNTYNKKSKRKRSLMNKKLKQRNKSDLNSKDQLLQRKPIMPLIMWWFMNLKTLSKILLIKKKNISNPIKRVRRNKRL